MQKMRGHTTIVRILVDKGINVNAQGGRYGSALQIAYRQSDETIVRLLFDKGADVNAQGGIHRNALQAACDQGNKTIVRLLLDKGANVNAQGGFHDTALEAANSRGHRIIVQLLLNNGAIDAKNEHVSEHSAISSDETDRLSSTSREVHGSESDVLDEKD